MKKLLLLFVILFSITSYAKNSHHIFLIHGIGGDITTFGDAKDVLENNLSKQSSNFNFKVDHFLYSTGNDSKTTTDFAADFDKHLDEYFKAHPLSDGDKFSIMAHSQGGVVSFNWLKRIYENKSQSYSSLFIENYMDSFVTLGTPFWGSQITEAAEEAKRLSRLGGLDTSDLPVALGDLELRDMAIGSKMYVDQARLMQDENFLNFLSSIRVLNIIGKFKYLTLSGISFNLDGDIAVPTPSAQLSYKFVDDQGEQNEISIGKSVVLDAPHSTIPKVALGIADIPKECVEDCNSLSLPYLENHFTNYTERDLKPGFTNSFVIHLSFKSDEEYKLNDLMFYMFDIRNSFSNATVDATPFHIKSYYDKESESFVNNFFFAGRFWDDDKKDLDINFKVFDTNHFSFHSGKLNIERGDYLFYDFGEL